jgi:hypothetical protein
MKVMDGTSGELSVEAYARLQVALADPQADAAAVLAMYGLDEERWAALDGEWQARIAAADSDEGVPPLVAAYAEAFVKAQRARAEEPIAFERYVELTRRVQRASDVPALLRELHVTFDQYLAAHAHFATRMASDPDLADRFTRAIGG